MRIYILAFIFLLFNTLAFSQQELEEGTFKFYVNGGVNTSQISNDSLGGFSKWGPVGGIGGFFMLGEKFSGNLELNYTMRGARGEVTSNPDTIYHRYIGTDYIEAPIFFSYHDKNVASFGAGIVLASLLKTSQAINYKNVDDLKLSTYNSLDIGFILNAVWYIKSNFAFNLRYIQSITPTNAVSPKYEAQYHSVLSIKGMYIF
jgi:hypothetical protein